mmetsp:Transcript_46708/g.144048  ORF Transcript_46708/g.144048 Transcript_46708/m.144048 type:complete len:315 (-) Transcript_46708:197-1141(-)
MLALLKAIEAYRKKKLSSLPPHWTASSRSEVPVLLYLDCAPVHVSAAFREAARKLYKHIRICYIPPRATSYLQPLDIAFFGPFKAMMKAAYIRRLVQVLVNAGQVTVSGGKATVQARIQLLLEVKNWGTWYRGASSDSLKTAIAAAFAEAGLGEGSAAAMSTKERNEKLSAKQEYTLPLANGPSQKAVLYDLFRVPEIVPDAIREARERAGIPQPACLKRGQWGVLPGEVAGDAWEDLEAIDANPRRRTDNAREGDELFDKEFNGSEQDSDEALSDSEDDGGDAHTAPAPAQQEAPAQPAEDRSRPPPPPAAQA